MAFAPPRNMDGPKLQTKMSTWTPLNHQLMNDKVFEERRALLGKWFDKWTDGQRRKILVDLLERCSLSQQKFCAKQLQDRVPTEALDFTTRLPRVLSLYIFSFLDPRSLCRCAQVSWHWKYLSELDQLWMLKCLRFGWYINFSPTPFEQGIWKKHYIEMVKELHVTRPKTPPKDEFVVIDVQPVRSNIPEAKPPVLGRRTNKEKKELPPWRSSDRHPTDTIRFNYLDNYDPIEQARQARKKGGGETPDLSRQAAEKKKRAGRGSNKLRKAKSLLSLTADLEPVPKPPVRPSWATRPSAGNLTPKAAAKTLAQSSQWNAGIRPAPVRAPVPKPRERGKKDFTRTNARSTPSPVFEAQPWRIPPSNQGSDTE
uniref:F-box protein 16 n=2 Tax=Anser TaxID=8842 RepID=A0A8B9DAI0_ANSCY|nr:F-box only protein 16 [Anser cygnoides]XP_013039922.1 F-box only protein 16 [Anser cygnoides]XP_013039923.1 F-box only protein 16 [Anser cygnoides]XP_013039925.1 F-box only protein 16 [Anser cygnoides]XP_013039927.1 F-box only protein 16 [Anser cygnoides]XP_013039928.1 F-box only protein 16 [Anser cygnoides]XP_013039929.1 F-box only protein 16 [Anser cygnoides]XP_013039930.1 F-box only protein 16 [Anser cygnoides]XP_013039932.1 F-box only protein 16 [Anser cygnoides]XP_013039933.1 F-box